MNLIIVGLGNPGKEYERTRHNAGRMAVELFARKEKLEGFVMNKKANALVAKGKIGSGEAILILPETFMNASGEAIAAFVKNQKAVKSLLVVHDDLDLSLGTLKMVVHRGSGGHKGVESVMRGVKTKNFTRLRLGIAPEGKKHQAKKLGDEEKVIKHVIGKFKPAEEATLKKMLTKAVETMQIYANDGMDAAAMFANTR